MLLTYHMCGDRCHGSGTPDSCTTYGCSGHCRKNGAQGYLVGSGIAYKNIGLLFLGAICLLFNLNTYLMMVVRYSWLLWNMHPKMREQRWDPWPKLHTFRRHTLRLIRSNNSHWWPAKKYKIILQYFHEFFFKINNN